VRGLSCKYSRKAPGLQNSVSIALLGCTVLILCLSKVRRCSPSGNCAPPHSTNQWLFVRTQEAAVKTGTSTGLCKGYFSPLQRQALQCRGQTHPLHHHHSLTFPCPAYSHIYSCSRCLMSWGRSAHHSQSTQTGKPETFQSCLHHCLLA